MKGKELHRPKLGPSGPIELHSPCSPLVEDRSYSNLIGLTFCTPVGLVEIFSSLLPTIGMAPVGTRVEFEM